MYGSDDEDFDLHAAFREYPVNLDHTVIYQKFNIDEPLNLLEAYIYDGKHIENIRRIMNRAPQEIYFRQLRSSNGIPSILYFAIESSSYVHNPLSQIIYNAIINMYMNPEIYTKLIPTPTNQMNLLSIAIQYNKPDLMIEICKKMESAETVYSYICTQRIVSYLLLQNNPELFKSAFTLLKNIHPAEALRYINKYAVDPEKDATHIMEKYLQRNYLSPSHEESKQFFEILGLHILRDTLPPYIGDTVRIIIRCHGSMLDESKTRIEYPFHRLCYFVEKGKYLMETCHVSNRVENMVCNGNYDDSLKCIPPIDGMIEIEPMQFRFDSGFHKGNRNSYTGIYVCQNRTVDRANEAIIDGKKKYLFPEVIDIVKTVCTNRQIDYANVDIMIFACRAMIGTTRPESVRLVPKITASASAV
jgi:hypothetical protein